MKSRTTADVVTGLHLWVKLTQASLEKANPFLNNTLISPGPGRLKVLVSKTAISRSMLIWDRILKTVETAGFTMRMESTYPGRTIVTVDGEQLSLRLREKVSRTEHVPTEAEKDRAERLGLPHAIPTWDHRPSGKLVFTIDYLTCHNQTVNQVTWTDSDKKRIEDRLDSVCDQLVEVAKDLKRRRALWEERESMMREEELRRRDAARLDAEHRKRIKHLERQVSAWAEACSIRQFIQVVRQEATRQTGVIEPGSPLDQWLQWAERHAASIDPVATVLASTNHAINTR